MLYHPPLMPMPPVPLGTAGGYDMGAGVALFCSLGSPVYSVEYGKVKLIEDFDVHHARIKPISPAKGKVQHLYVGNIHYCCIEVSEGLSEGDFVTVGQEIGRTVLEVDSDHGNSFLQIKVNQSDLLLVQLYALSVKMEMADIIQQLYASGKLMDPTSWWSGKANRFVASSGTKNKRW